MEMKPPVVTCTGCDRNWMSASMAEGLRLLGHCPRCGGILSFADEASPSESRMGRLAPEDATTIAPHLVLGIPRRID